MQFKDTKLRESKVIRICAELAERLSVEDKYGREDMETIEPQETNYLKESSAIFW